MKNLVILSQAPLTPQIKRNNYVDEYLSVGYDVQFWDMSQLIHPGMKYNDELCEPYLRNISLLFEFEQLLSSVDSLKTIFVLDFDASWHTRNIFKILTKYHCYMIRVDMYANTSLQLTLKQKLSQLFSNRFSSILITRLGIYLYKIYAWFYNISDCQRYYSSSAIVNRTDKINHPDYEDFCFSKSRRIIEGNYILFVDTNFGFHPDDIYFFKYSKIPTTEKFQASLDDFFTYLEKKYRMPVIIAAHPKSNYVNGEFVNRRIIKYQTKDLIIYADKVILQLCNTISWVTLADKPLIFVTTDDYDVLALQRKRLRFLASLLGKKVYNIEHCNFSDIIFTTVEKEIRLHYIYTYLTDKDIEKRKNIDILKDSYETVSLTIHK